MFRLVDNPTIMPGQTLIGTTTGPVVDTGVVLLNGGRVYVSQVEAGEIVRHFPHVVAERAAAIGWASPKTVASLEAEISRLDGELAEARLQQTRVVPVDELAAYFNDLMQATA